MPPNVGSQPLSLTVTLTSVRGSRDTRTLTLKPGQPCSIGRASKSATKNLQSSPNNALYDCAVISREHAELRVHLWDRPENQVTITDNRSMHGTYVNGRKLAAGQATPLRSGDTIQFGEKVTRGENTHNGIYVTFDKREELSQQSHTLATHTSATNTSRGYRYPYTSDEESEYNSDDHVSVVSDKDEVMEVSSAHTTPEQAKAQLGTQEQPIDLDQPQQAKTTLIQDSVDNEDSVLVADSVPVVLRRAVHVDIDSARGDDDDLVSKPATGPADEGSVILLDLHEVIESADDAENPNIEQTEEPEDVSDSEASELDHYSELEQSDIEEDEEDAVERSPSHEASKQASPELRSSGQARPWCKPVPSATWSNSHLSTSSTSSAGAEGPRYDPSRGSHSYSTHSQPAYRPTLPSTYHPFGYNTIFDDPTNYGQPMPSYGPFDVPAAVAYPAPSGLTRWDKLPTVPRMGLTTKPYSSGWGVPAASADDFGFSQAWSTAPTTHNDPFGNVSYNRSYAPQPPKLTTPAQAPSRISIPDIVENEQRPSQSKSSGALSIGGAAYNPSVATVTKAVGDETRDTMEEAWTTGHRPAKDDMMAGNSSSTGASASGKKRKAEESVAKLKPFAVDNETVAQLISDGIVYNPFEAVASANKDDSKTEASSVEETAPTPKRVKTSKDMPTTTTTGRASTSSVAASVAKYAAVGVAAASAGGAGMFAYLASPASERLLTYLSSA